MIESLKKNYLEIEASDRLFYIIFTLFPLSLILGNLIINIFIFLFGVSFFINKDENYKYFKNKIVILLFFFFISLLINIFFSQNLIHSYPRVIKIFFIIFFMIDALRIFNKYDFNITKNIFIIWLLIFSIVLFDCFFEIIFGFNMIGNKSTFDGRIASFFGSELVVGSFIHGFSLYLLGFLISENKTKYILPIVVICILIASILIGERSNFIKTFICIFLFLTIAIKSNYLQKILILFSIISIFLIILNFNSGIKMKYYNQLSYLFEKNGISKFYKNSQYGAHKDTALKIFNEFPIFGVGIKNFRYESGKEKYFNSDYSASSVRRATHPHQIHLEFLSETGLFGYLSFLIFILSSLIISIQNYIKNKNIFQLAGIIFIFTTLIPLLPSGSFLSTFNSGIFWINFAIMTAFYKSIKINKI